MPHLTLQYTSNIAQKVDFDNLFAQCHRILADVGGIKIENCKSRAIKLDDYTIGSGEPDDAFVHVDLKFLAGRTEALKQEIGNHILNILRKTYTPSLAERNLQITIQIQDIQRETYFKIPEGSLTIQ
jgi:5-carboxymethyl-2-hydroxymuconate isomerase